MKIGLLHLRIKNIQKEEVDIINNNEIMIYEDKDGITKVNVKFTDEDLWVSKYQIADLYKTTRQNIEQHVNNIYKDKELDKDSTCKNFLQVQREGKRDVKRNINRE